MSVETYLLGTTEKGKYSPDGCRCFYFYFSGLQKMSKTNESCGLLQESIKKINTNYDYVANIKLKMTAPLYKGQFNWQVDVLAPEKETKKKNIIFTFYFNYCF